MTDLTKAIVDLQADMGGRTYGLRGPNDYERIILNAVASDELIPATDAKLAVALALEKAAEMDPVAAPDTAAIRGALLSLPAVYAHQINTGVREVYDPLQRFYRMEDVLRALIPKRTADDRA